MLIAKFNITAEYIFTESIKKYLTYLLVFTISKSSFVSSHGWTTKQDFLGDGILIGNENCFLKGFGDNVVGL